MARAVILLSRCKPSSSYAAAGAQHKVQRARERHWQKDVRLHPRAPLQALVRRFPVRRSLFPLPHAYSQLRVGRVPFVL